MLKLTALVVAAAGLGFAASSFADTGHTPDGNVRPDLYGMDRHDSRRQVITIGRHGQMYNPGYVLRINDGAPYALSGDTDRVRSRVQVLNVGSRQIAVGMTHDR